MIANNKRVWTYSLIASLGGLLFGFDIAIFSGTIPFIKPKFSLSSEDLGWMASSLYIGCIFGSILFGKIAERLGRKPSMIWVAIIFMLSSIMMGISDTVDSIVIWRVIAGFSVGGASVLSPLYIAEISPQRVRGKMVSINQLAIVIGILLAYFSNYYLAHVEGNWRWMFISGCVPAFLFLLASLVLPESPKWLVYKGQVDKGRKILDVILPEEEVSKEIQYIQVQKNQAQESQWSILKSLFGRQYVLLVVTAIVIAVFQQISGANAVLFYAPIIFERVGMDINDQLFIQILIGSVNLLFTLVAIRFVDRIGRKKMMMIGAITMSTLLLLIGISFQGTYIPKGFVTFFVLLFIGVYAATLAPVTWVIISEIFPIKIREQAMSIASAFLWMACFGITYAFPVMIEYLSIFQTFLTFASLCALYFLFLWFFVPETKSNKV